MQLKSKYIKLPKLLTEQGFSLDTHLFRYRNDHLIQNNDGTTALGYGVNELFTNSIWHSCIGALNDPFEVYFKQNAQEAFDMSDSELFYYWVNSFESDKFQKEILESFYKNNNDDIKKTLTNNIGSYIHILKEIFRKHTAMACFSLCCDSRLMWGYYCSGFKGFCLIYNIERLKKDLAYISEVIYSPHRPSLDVISYFIKRKKNQSILDIADLARYKHSEWEHEKEYRSLLMIDDDKDINNGGVCIQLSESCVDGVIIGEGCNKKTREALIEFSKEKNIKTFYSSADLDTFSILIS